MGDVVVSTFAERPEYVQRVHEMADLWPDFMGRDATANALLGQVIPAFPQLGVVATVDGAPIARGRAIPFALHVDGRRELPDGGWDRVLVWGMDDRADGAPTDTVSALEIAIDPRHLGTGPVRAEARGDADRGDRRRVRRAGRSGPTERQAPDAGDADGRARAADPAGRTPRGPVAACPRPRRCEHRLDDPGLHGDVAVYVEPNVWVRHPLR